YPIFDRLVREATDGRAFVVEIEVTEDSKNSVRFSVLDEIASKPSGSAIEPQSRQSVRPSC
ncbi:MAG TPA: hypothetical protein VFJ90_11890, partial [Candidatus Didemnitutus sp.]|nr:hypothetical protein [Candidatus Didemnitutus sp.]